LFQAIGFRGSNQAVQIGAGLGTANHLQFCLMASTILGFTRIA
jgi:hypothetical protein